MNLHGGGISERSFIYIKDVVDATLELDFKCSCWKFLAYLYKRSYFNKNLVKKICQKLMLNLIKL